MKEGNIYVQRVKLHSLETVPCTQLSDIRMVTKWPH